MKKLSILLLIIAAVIIIALAWWKQALKPAEPENSKTVLFAISRGETIRSIAEKLHNQGLIRSPVAFFLIARFTGLGSKIQSGEFRLNPSMDLNKIADTLTHGTLDVQITIPEGWRNAEIALKLTKDLNIPEAEFLKVAKEGYMFPDTYSIPKDATASQAASIFLNNFNSKVSGSSLDKSARQKGLTLDELVILASLVEREARYDIDRPLVAGILLNRMKQDMKLDIDATVQYIVGYQTSEKTWWKKDLTADDLKIDSPYNTYLHNGLPPTPISNPGLKAMQAIIDAPETDYLYYISDKSGHIHPARTLEEQNVNISKYL